MSATGDLHLGRLGQVALSVRDVPRAEAFYATTLGLPHLFTFGDLAFFDMAGTRLYLQRQDDADWGPGSLLYFVVDDIHAAVAALEGRGVAFRGAPHRIHTHTTAAMSGWRSSTTPTATRSRSWPGHRLARDAGRA